MLILCHSFFVCSCVLLTILSLSSESVSLGLVDGEQFTILNVDA